MDGPGQRNAGREAPRINNGWRWTISRDRVTVTSLPAIPPLRRRTGIYFFRSTDQGATFGPNLGTLIVTGSQGAFVAVGPDHSVYAFWYAGTTIQMRKSTDQGLTFGPPVTVASGLVGGVNGDLALTGIRQGTTTPAGFRSNEFPHAVVNPVNGNIYATFANNPAGVDKADIFVVQSTDGGATWGPQSESTTMRPRPTSGNRRWRSRRTAPILASSTTAVRKTRSTTTCSSFMDAPPVSQAQR